jgi:hypothetical protein
VLYFWFSLVLYVTCAHLYDLLFSFCSGNLAYNDSNQLAIAKAGAIPALVSLIIKSTPTAMERAISALGNLAFNDVNRKAIPKAGAIAPLVFLLTEGNQVMQEQSALALGEASAVCMWE